MNRLKEFKHKFGVRTKLLAKLLGYCPGYVDHLYLYEEVGEEVVIKACAEFLKHLKQTIAEVKQFKRDINAR